MRLSDHHFQMETGRRQNIERNKRFCTKCKQNLVGDETHVYFECSNPSNTKLRFKFLTQISDILPQFKLLNNSSKFKYLLAMHESSITILTVNFCHTALKIYS